VLSIPNTKFAPTHTARRRIRHKFGIDIPGEVLPASSASPSSTAKSITTRKFSRSIPTKTATRSTSGERLSVNYGTLYPALPKLEQEGYISSEWGTSDNTRKARYYKLTRAGRKQLEREAKEWAVTTAILARFLHNEQPS
jgi:hypothetical protein